jgi:hypothetical protein
MLTRRVAQASTVGACRTVYAPMSKPLGQGKVIKVDFDFHKPAYVVPMYGKSFSVLVPFLMWCWAPGMAMCGMLVMAKNGALTGQYPPDPHALWN